MKTEKQMERWRVGFRYCKLRGSNGKVARSMGQLDRQTQRKKAEAVRHGAGPGKMHAPVGSLFFFSQLSLEGSLDKINEERD